MLRRLVALGTMLRAERAPAAQLAARQATLLRALLRAAVRDVPFYRDLYARHGVDALRIQGAADLARLPMVDKRQLREAGRAAVRRDATEQPPVGGFKYIETSGSTGEPFRFPIDRSYDQWRKAQYLRPYLTNGRRLCDVVLRLTAFPRGRAPTLQRLGLLRETQLDCATDPAAVLDCWRASGATILQGYPSSLRALAHYCLERGRALDPKPRRIFTDSELLTGDTRRLVASVLSAPVIDVYGTYETDNIAYQCEAGGGYHVTTDAVVIEVVREGRVQPPGEAGELVVTVLHNHCSPFIRYNLHDTGRYATQSCRCGRSFPLLEIAGGRADDLLVLPDGSQRSAMHVLGQLDGFGTSLRRYQLRQRGPWHFRLLIEPGAQFEPQVPQRLQQMLSEQLPGARITIEVTPAIPLARSGKLLAFCREADGADE